MLDQHGKDSVMKTQERSPHRRPRPDTRPGSVRDRRCPAPPTQLTRFGARRRSRQTAWAPRSRFDVQVGKHRITLSENGFRPGNTVFNVHFSPAHGHAAVQLRPAAPRLHVRGVPRRPRRATTSARSAASTARPSSTVACRRRADVPATSASDSSTGNYWLFDFDTPRRVSLRVDGAPQRRTLPRDDRLDRHGDAAREHRFATPTDPAQRGLAEADQPDRRTPLHGHDQRQAVHDPPTGPQGVQR